MTCLRPVIAAFFLIFSLGIGHSGQVHAEIQLKFGVYAADKPTEVAHQFAPVVRALEKSLTKKLGEPVAIDIQIAASYQTGIHNLVSGHVDFARFGPASYVLAKQKSPGIEILAMESVKGRKTFRGVICVPRDSSLQTIADIKGRTFAFGDQRSTIGRYLSQRILVQNNVFANDLKTYDYLKRHDRVGTAVGRKQYDAGALKEGTFNKLVAKGIAIKALAYFPNVTKPWISRSGLSVELHRAIRTALLDMKDGAALKVLKKDGFLEGDDDDYAFIRQAIAENSAFFE